jgi:DNA transposition AAA+ family ATPase
MEIVRPYVPSEEFFVEISAVKRIRDGIGYAMNMGEPIQVVSEPGHGKTTALYYLAKQLGGVYCPIGHVHKSAPDMYRLLLDAFRIAHDAKYNRDLFDALVRHLRPTQWEREEGPRRLLIIDESQTLEPTAQRDLLNIQETCNLALVISGNGERLAKSSLDRSAWKQIDHRLGMKIKLPGLSGHDCELMGAAYGVEGMNAYEAIRNFGTKTTARDLGRLLREAKALTGSTRGIQLKDIQNVLKAKPEFADLKLLRSEAA